MSYLSPELILASSSPYRAAMLAKLRLPFQQVSPAFAEHRLAGESPAGMAERLAEGKALAVSRLHPEALVIGSDQVVSVGAQLLDKPGTHARAHEQLRLCSGQWVSYTTGLCLARNQEVLSCEHAVFQVLFRELTDAEIHAYLQIDQPFDCAGSIKAEAFGITLLLASRGDDVHTLYGLPLMMLVGRLRELGINPLQA